MKLIDCHAHLAELSDLGGALRRAASAGVEGIIAVATGLASSRRVLDLCREFSAPRLAPAIGLYPTEATEAGISEISAMIEAERRSLSALGEIGLDFWDKSARRPGAGRNLQERAFRAQLELARRFSLVPIVHSRGAWEECLRLVCEAGVPRAVFHWYTGPLDVLARLLTAGHYISASPAAEGSSPHRAALQVTPLERMVLETDCPVPRREGEAKIPTEPADVARSLRAVAGIKGLPEGEVAAITTDTTRSLFQF